MPEAYLEGMKTSFVCAAAVAAAAPEAYLEGMKTALQAQLLLCPVQPEAYLEGMKTYSVHVIPPHYLVARSLPRRNENHERLLQLAL